MGPCNYNIRELAIKSYGTNCALAGGGVMNFFHLSQGGVRTFFHVVEGGGVIFFIGFISCLLNKVPIIFGNPLVCLSL